uniref:Furin (paired basic amino acid cleaving enzyme) a n=1 Tax=Salarias fasciatus TaxID=181472 RepID=A0A672HQ42_SALFA
KRRRKKKNPDVSCCFIGFSVKFKIYTNTWAVHIPGGQEEADRIAGKHGFINHGHVSNTSYHFKVVCVRVSASISLHPVSWAEQQLVKRRKKRDVFVEPRDPKYRDQWYLVSMIVIEEELFATIFHYNGDHRDLNAKAAWQLGYTGKGVVVSILDDGIEKNHPDLSDNYDPGASYDVNDGDPDPQPRYTQLNDNRHGTRCAGEVAAVANNGVCGVGVAYNAKIGGVRMLDGEVTDMVEAQSLSLNPQHIDVYSASWGPEDDGKTVDGPAKLAKEAFLRGVTEGRGGLGSIFVWASGNGGREKDSCNCDGYTNSIYTLSISSSTQNGNVPWYSEACSSTLATTYSSGNLNEKQIVSRCSNHCRTVHPLSPFIQSWPINMIMNRDHLKLHLAFLLLLNILLTNLRSLPQMRARSRARFLPIMWRLAVTPLGRTAYDIPMTCGCSLNAALMYSFNCTVTHEPENGELE